MTAKDLRELSLHEAAHAVAALDLGIHLSDTKLDEDERGGQTAVFHRVRTVEDAEKSIVWTLAPRTIIDELRRQASGPWFLGEGRPWSSYRSDAPGNERTDDKRALETARAVTQSEAAARNLVMAGHRRAMAMAKRPFILAAVQKVAGELLAKRRLDNREVRRLVLESDLELRAARLEEIGAPRRTRPSGTQDIIRGVMPIYLRERS
jgi:hypothetical protein